MSEDSEASVSQIATTVEENCNAVPLSSANSSSAIIKPTPKRRKLAEADVHRNALLKQACDYLANTKDEDEYELWGKSVAATLRNYPDATAVRMAKSKMNQIMASLEAGELNPSKPQIFLISSSTYYRALPVNFVPLDKIKTIIP